MLLKIKHPKFTWVGYAAIDYTPYGHPHVVNSHHSTYAASITRALHSDIHSLIPLEKCEESYEVLKREDPNKISLELSVEIKYQVDEKCDKSTRLWERAKEVRHLITRVVDVKSVTRDRVT